VDEPAMVMPVGEVKGRAKTGIMARACHFLPRAIGSRGTFALANQGIVSATNFLTGVALGRFCAKEQFGLYMLGFSIVMLMAEVQIALISTPYMIYSPRLESEELRLYNGSSLLHQLIFSLLLILVLAAWSGCLSFGFGPPGLAPILSTLAAVIGFILLREFIRRFCFAHLHMGTALVFDSVISVLQLGGLALLVQFGCLSAKWAIGSIGGACCLASIVWLLLNRKTFAVRRGRSLADLKTNWNFARWVFASGILWAVSMNLYPWFLTVFHGTASAGVWGACLGVLALVNVPLMSLQNFIGPKIAKVYAEGGTGALRRFVFETGLLVGSVMGVLCCALFLLGGPLMTLLYGARYAGHGTVVFVLALSLVAASVAFGFSRALFALERADIDFKVNFVPLLILFTCGIWLTRSQGPLGAAYGLLLANLAAAAVRFASFTLLCRRSAAGAFR